MGLKRRTCYYKRDLLCKNSGSSLFSLFRSQHSLLETEIETSRQVASRKSQHQIGSIISEVYAPKTHSQSYNLKQVDPRLLQYLEKLDHSSQNRPLTFSEVLYRLDRSIF